MLFRFLTFGLPALFFSSSLLAQLPNVGDVVINEILASNTNGARDENAEFEDWIELYNKTTQAKSLFGLYLTDKRENPDKWEFPNGTFIPASGFLIVWADEDSSQGPLHTNFKLSAGGEFVMLSDGANVVYDSIGFGTQQADVSFGRYPNGTGGFVTMPPTFNSTNSLTNSTEEQDGAVVRVHIFPNPVAEELVVRSQIDPLPEIRVYDAAGRLHRLLAADGSTTEYRIPVSDWAAGTYVLYTGAKALATFVKM